MRSRIFKIAQCVVLVLMIPICLFSEPVLITSKSTELNTEKNSKELLVLPAPAKFQADSITTNLIRVKWDAVPGASEYFLKVTQVSNGVVVFSNTVGGTTQTVNSLPPVRNTNLKSMLSVGLGLLVLAQYQLSL